MMLPGKAAKEFRRISSGLLTRLFAGDPTLHDLIIENGLSDGILPTFARTDLANKKGAVEMPVGGVFVLEKKDVDEVAMEKKIRMANMEKNLVFLQHEVCTAKMFNFKEMNEFEESIYGSMKLAPVARKMLDDRKVNRVMTMTDNLFRQGFGCGVQQQLEDGTSSGDRVFVADVITKMKIEGSPEDLNILAKGAGKIAAASFRMKYPGQEPIKVSS